ncbi:hypothetical protein [Siphonobacter curvatus]|uniref:Uncharacterized protein n=1 Tax=Siphonobacter curvatus TaxID=2094562 RepID=A0A2S7IS07_9BACT|nr:hypothetical protein [Siphonobacter curvatus]PQA60370.1 hypothetical protein C5O19_12350 [Siphonobacter curvatus]
MPQVYWMLLLCFLTGHLTDGYSQGSTPPASAYAQHLYQKATSTSASYYNGKEYTIQEFRPQGHQFFESMDWLSASLSYDGIRYDNLPLLYDINRDLFILRNHDGLHRVIPDQSLLENVTIGTHTFVRIRQGLKPGFYERLYDGKTKIFCKRTKDRTEDLSQQRVLIIYTPHDYYYLLKDGQYIPVNSKKSILTALSDRKKELRKYARALNFREDRENAIRNVVAYYDQIK